MSAFFVALRESVNDPEEMRLYAEKAGISAQGHHLIPRVQYGRLRMTEGCTHRRRCSARVSDVRGSRGLV